MKELETIKEALNIATLKGCFSLDGAVDINNAIDKIHKVYSDYLNLADKYTDLEMQMHKMKYPVRKYPKIDTEPMKGQIISDKPLKPHK